LRSAPAIADIGPNAYFQHVSPVAAKLELRAVSHAFSSANGQTADALDGVTMSIPDRKFVSILGPSGCGKSTIFNIIAGLLVPSLGDVYLNGEKISGMIGFGQGERQGREGGRQPRRAREHLSRGAQGSDAGDRPRDNGHKDEMLEFAKKEFPTAPADGLTASLERIFKDHIYSTDGYIPPEAWTLGNAVVKEGGVLKQDVPYDDVVDMSFVKEVRKELKLD
jgi:energy-coupling factor transporter ATP-binding protein EcfA2